MNAMVEPSGATDAAVGIAPFGVAIVSRRTGGSSGARSCQTMTPVIAAPAAVAASQTAVRLRDGG